MDEQSGHEPGNGDAELSNAAQLGRTAGRFARRARKALRETEPEARRLARAASDAAQPLLEQAADFARAHEDELKQAGRAGARAAISRSVPPILRPLTADLVDGLKHEASDSDSESVDQPEPNPRV